MFEQRFGVAGEVLFFQSGSAVVSHEVWFVSFFRWSSCHKMQGVCRFGCVLTYV